MTDTLGRHAAFEYLSIGTDEQRQYKMQPVVGKEDCLEEGQQCLSALRNPRDPDVAIRISINRTLSDRVNAECLRGALCKWLTVFPPLSWECTIPLEQSSNRC